MTPRLTTAGNRRVPILPVEVTCIVSRRSELAQRRSRALPGTFHGWRQVTPSKLVSLLIMSCGREFPVRRALGRTTSRELARLFFLCRRAHAERRGSSCTALGFTARTTDLRRTAQPSDSIAMGLDNLLRPPLAHKPGVVFFRLRRRNLLITARVRALVVGIPSGYRLPRPSPATGIGLSLLWQEAVCAGCQVPARLLFAMRSLVRADVRGLSF